MAELIDQQPTSSGSRLNLPSLNIDKTRGREYIEPEKIDGNFINMFFKDKKSEIPQSLSQQYQPSPMSGPVIPMGTSGEFLNVSGPVTQEFGNRSSVEKYSGGVNYGTDFAVPRGTKVSAPSGDWIVVDSFAGATIEGPNNRQGGINKGYGNSVLLQNTSTGEKLRFSHLASGGVGVKKGQRIKGGQVIGLTGATGNTAGRTGQHLDVEYYDNTGRIKNVRNSPYAKYIFGGKS